MVHYSKVPRQHHHFYDGKNALSRCLPGKWQNLGFRLTGLCVSPHVQEVTIRVDLYGLQSCENRQKSVPYNINIRGVWNVGHQHQSSLKTLLLWSSLVVCVCALPSTALGNFELYTREVCARQHMVTA